MTGSRLSVTVVFSLSLALTGQRSTAILSADLGVSILQTAGESVLTGRIVDGDAMPVDRAIVKLVGSDGPGARIAVSDRAGRFRFAGLAAGSFAISAAKAGYVTTFYGSARPGRGPAVPIALAPGQSTAVSMSLFRAAGVSGTITGEFGQPMPQVQVQLRPVSGQSAADLAPVATDNRGAFRLFGVAPGDYVVATMVPSAMSAQAALVTDDEVRWALEQLSRNGTGGPASGRLSSPAPGPTVGYAPVFYPGTTVLDDAIRISLSPGEERDVTFSLRFTPSATISGTVETSVGSPSPATLFLLPKSPTASSSGEVTANPVQARQVVVSDTGRFSIPSAPAGVSTLFARWDPDVATRVNGPTLETRWGELDVQVNGQDLHDLVITLQPGAPLSGRVRFETKAGAVPPEFAKVRVRLSPARNTPLALTGNLSASIGDAGAFAFSSLTPGSYAVKVAPESIPGSNGALWVLKSVVAAGQDVTDGYLEVRSNAGTPDIVVTLTDQQTELSGILFDAANRPTSAFAVVVFSATPAFWTKESRHVRAAQPATDGTFRMAGLPAGAYYVVAVADLDSDALGDPESLERMRQSALPFSLGDGEKRSLNLKIGG
jgi:uncharacterized protein (DUF2141 family)